MKKLRQCHPMCGRLSWLHVSFWAHVNIVHHIISYSPEQLHTSLTDILCKYQIYNLITDNTNNYQKIHYTTACLDIHYKYFVTRVSQFTRPAAVPTTYQHHNNSIFQNVHLQIHRTLYMDRIFIIFNV